MSKAGFSATGTMKPGLYETVRSVDEPNLREGVPGKKLFEFREPLRWLLGIIAVYAVASVALAIWVLLGPEINPGRRVLRTGNIRVDQFYSGLALSILLTPAAITIRRLAHDLALLHPFAVSSMTPTRIADFDVMMDPGVNAMARLARYSFSAAGIQALLLVSGACLMPVGTLLVTTGDYAAPTAGVAIAGMPTAYENMMIMDIEMGILVQQTGVIGVTNPVLGPISTPNITFEEDVRYGGLVTYTWSSGCEYTDEITFSEYGTEYSWMFNITSPAGSSLQNDAWESKLFMWNETNRNTSSRSPTTTYFAAIGTVEETVNLADAEDGILVLNGSWISRVKCNPTMDWEISDCLWNGSAMVDCYPAPGTNTSLLDVEGLNELPHYLSQIPLWIYLDSSYVLGLMTIQVPLMFDIKATTDHEYRAPVLADYNDMYGLAARSLAAATTAGYYGTAEVPMRGSISKPVYIVRTYILGLVMSILLAVPILTAFNVFLYVTNHLPIRRATFLTVANAVRGPWWDTQLWGGCSMSPEAVRAAYGDKCVMYGVDERCPQHIGLGPDTLPIQPEHLYFGLKEQ